MSDQAYKVLMSRQGSYHSSFTVSKGNCLSHVLLNSMSINGPCLPLTRLLSHRPPIPHNIPWSCCVIQDAAEGLAINIMGRVVQPLRFMCTSAGKMQDLPDSPQALESSLALAPFSNRTAILAVKKVPAQTFRHLAFRMIQAPQPLQQEPDALIADWGQLMDRNTDLGEGNFGLTGICPLACHQA